MKKIFITAGLVASAAAFAQATGKVGVNTATPAATLEITPTTTNAADGATTNEGILIPRLTAARVAATAAPVVGTLVYVTNAPSGANATSFSDTTAGFYYWNGTIWTKMGAGAAGVANNLYTADGVLATARTVNQNNQNLTFTTGTGQMQINGTSNLMGAQYAKIRTQTLPMSAADWQANDYAVILTGSPTNAFSLPDPAAYTGRIIAFSNQTGGTLGISTYIPLNNSSIEGGKGFIVMSNGTNWVCIGGY